jgi:hypothetical protein
MRLLTATFTTTGSSVHVDGLPTFSAFLRTTATLLRLHSRGRRLTALLLHHLLTTRLHHLHLLRRRALTTHARLSASTRALLLTHRHHLLNLLWCGLLSALRHGTTHIAMRASTALALVGAIFR